MAKNDSPYSFESVVAFANKNFGLLFMAGLIFIAGFFAGSLWTENELLRSGSGGTGTANAGAAAPTAAAPSGNAAEIPEITDEDHIRGSRNADVILVEYSDFECPFCARFHPTMEQVRAEYGDSVAWVYRHYPLQNLHPNAQKAAEGSECAAKLGGDDAFWAYGDALIDVTTANGRLTPQALKDAATDVGLNASAFSTCLDSGEMADKVAEQQAGGARAGVSGTPGTIVVTADGGQELISGALPFAQVQAVIERYL